VEPQSQEPAQHCCSLCAVCHCASCKTKPYRPTFPDCSPASHVPSLPGVVLKHTDTVCPRRERNPGCPVVMNNYSSVVWCVCTPAILKRMRSGSGRVRHKVCMVYNRALVRVRRSLSPHTVAATTTHSLLPTWVSEDFWEQSAAGV
jgi:hypothetical protein